MEVRLKLNEAIARSQANGKKIFKKELASKLWEGSTGSTQQVNMTNLCNGTTKKISTEWVLIICETLDCSPNFLFGYDE